MARNSDLQDIAYRDELKSFRSDRQDLRVEASRSFSAVNGIKVVLFTILMVLLIVAFYRSCVGLDPMLFTDFINTMADMPKITAPLDSIGLITDDWLAFNFLRDFFNIFISGLNLLVFLGSLVVQLVVFIGYVLKSLFLVV